MLEDQVTKDLFCRTLLEPETRKPSDFFATHVKILVIADIYLDHKIVSALKTCRGVQTLVIWARCSNRELQELFGASEALLTTKRLSLFSESFLESRYRFHYPIFQNVTHLDLVCDDEDAWKRDRLSQLSHLTHLSLDVRFKVTSAARLVGDVLHACLPSLCILVLWLDLEYFDDGHQCFGDIKAISAGDIDIRAAVACMRSGYVKAEKYASICCDCDVLPWYRC